MRKQIEMLENHTHLLTMFVYIYLFVGDIDPLKDYASARGLLKKIERAQKRTFA